MAGLNGTDAGMTPETLRKAFDPFFTTSRAWGWRWLSKWSRTRRRHSCRRVGRQRHQRSDHAAVRHEITCCERQRHLCPSTASRSRRKPKCMVLVVEDEETLLNAVLRNCSSGVDFR